MADRTERAPWPGPGTIAAVAALGLLVARGIVAWRTGQPTSNPDEAGFLGSAWFLGNGGPAPPMYFAPVYKVGLPVLLAPIAFFIDDPATLETAARLVNVALVASLVPLLAALVRRLGVATPNAAVVAGLGAACLPALWVASAIVWPDALGAVLFVLALVALGAMARPGPLARRVWFGPTVAWLWVTHDRFLPLVALAAVVLAVRLVRPDRALGRAAESLNVALLGLVAALGQLLNDWVVDLRWGTVTPGVFEGFGAGDLDDVARNFVAQWWYLLTSTYGTAGVGFVALVAAAWGARRQHRFWRDPAALVSGFAVASVLGVQVAAAVQLRRPLSFELIANGRYQDAVTPVLVAVGLARLMRFAAEGGLARAGGRIAAALLATGAATIVLVAGRDEAVDYATASGIEWMRRIAPSQPVLVPTLLALAGVGLVVLLGRRRPGVVAALVIVGLATAGVASGGWIVDRSNPESPELVLADRTRDLRGPSAFDTESLGLGPSYFVTWRVAGYMMEGGGDALDDAEVVVTDVRGSAAGEGARLATVASDGSMATWVRPGDVQDRLAADGLLYPPGAEPIAEEARSARVDLGVPRRVAGRWVVPLRITHTGDGSVWPSALAAEAVPVEVTVTGVDGPQSRTRTAVPELRPGESAELLLDLRTVDPDPGDRLDVVVAQGLALVQVEGDSSITVPG